MPRVRNQAPGVPIPEHEHDPEAPEAPPPPAPRPRKSRWGWLKWLAGGAVLGISGYEALRFWRTRVRGEKNPEESLNPPQPVGPMLPAPPIVPIVIPQFMPPMNMFGAPPPPAARNEVDIEDELARLNAKRKRNRKKMMADIVDAFAEDDD